MRKLLAYAIATCMVCSFGSHELFAQTDTAHFSSLFQTKKPYRIFLPAGYSGSSKKYPVIYFFHGNQGSHAFAVEGIQQLVDENQVIFVAWNGRSVPEDLRPYNAGYHSNIKYPVQFADYFIEFVNHIDSNYRTLNDRAHRALIGHSMGGFMSFLLAAKYPQLVGTAVNMKGSSEFFVGYPANHTLYQVRYMFENLYGVRLRFHNSTVDELVHLNNEVNNGAARIKGLSYDYKIYPGGHGYTAPEFTDAFNYIIESFRNPLPVPARWNHADLYPAFNVWGYEIKSNLREPGYIGLKSVTKGGMGIRTRKWQPDGPLIPGTEIHIQTAPLYKPLTPYTVFDYNETDHTKKDTIVTSDEKGRLALAVNYQSHQLGIFEKKGPAELVYINHKVDGRDIFLNHNRQSNLRILLLNRGGSDSKKIRVTLSTAEKNITITNPVIQFENIPAGNAVWSPAEFKITAQNKPTTDGSPFRVRFTITMTGSDGNTWKDEFDAPVYYSVPAFKNIGIDDGDSEIFGSGNGNNIAEPGETVMIYQDSHRTRLYYDDPYIDGERLYDELQPDKWGDGYALSSLIHIAKNCPVGHTIRFLACYEVKEWKTIKRNVTWGTFTITVGK